MSYNKIEDFWKDFPKIKEAYNELLKYTGPLKLPVIYGPDPDFKRQLAIYWYSNKHSNHVEFQLYDSGLWDYWVPSLSDNLACPDGIEGHSDDGCIALKDVPQEVWDYLKVNFHE